MASYAQELANKLSSDCRTLFASSFYQELFSTRLSRQRQALQEFTTTKKGFRMATSVGGVLIGRGADWIVLDDALKPEEALSNSQRHSVNNWYDHTLYSRLNDKRTGSLVIIAQRLHEDDLIGHVLELPGDWKILRFPAIAEQDETHVIQTIFGERRFERRQGEALHAPREPLDVLAQIRERLGEYNFAGQYQQAPAPLGGGMVKVEWFKTYTSADLPAKFDSVIQGWDSASKATELSHFPVCTSWAIKDKHLFLINVFRKRMNYPELKRAVREQPDEFRATIILIEDRASGIQLLQELIDDGVHGVQRHEPSMDKIMRMNSVTSTIENGSVHLPQQAHWLPEYVHELTTFPNGKHDDQVDSTSQFLDWIKRGQDRLRLIEYFQHLNEARKPPQVMQPFMCPKCGAAPAQHGEQWKCNMCGSSGTHEIPKCGNCGSLLTTRIGTQLRCQQCGTQWGPVQVQRGPTREEILQGFRC